MKASELAKHLMEAAATFGDPEVECRNAAGDITCVEGVVSFRKWNDDTKTVILITDDKDEEV